MFLPKGLYEVIFRGENGGYCHQHHHDLPGVKAPPHQHMAQKAVVGVLVVGLDLEGLQHVPDGMDDGLALFVLDLALLHRHDAVGVGLVDAGDHISLPVPAQDRVDFVSIVIGVFHANDGADLPILGKKLSHLLFLLLQLLLIGDALITAAAAFFCCFTGFQWFHLLVLVFPLKPGWPNASWWTGLYCSGRIPLRRAVSRPLRSRCRSLPGGRP